VYRIRKKGYHKRVWTPEQDEIIRTMILDGKSYTQICKAFTPPGARGAILYRVETMAKAGVLPTPKRMI
jgi:hypothetical protein